METSPTLWFNPRVGMREMPKIRKSENPSGISTSEFRSVHDKALLPGSFLPTPKDQEQCLGRWFIHHDSQWDSPAPEEPRVSAMFQFLDRAVPVDLLLVP